MTTQKKHPILTAAQQYVATKSISMSTFAKQVNYSDAAISQLFAGKYQGDSDAIIRRIASVIGYSTTTEKWRTLATANMEVIQSMASDAQSESRMFCAHGETGSGKTAALTYYSRNTPNCYYILADVLMKPKDLIKTIQFAIGCEDEGTLSSRIDAVCEKLADKANPLLIIDDAGKLEQHPKCFFVIQLLYDKMLNRCGILLAGTNRLPKYINKQAAKDLMGFRELRRRISYWQELRSTVERKFITTQCAAFGITLPSAIDYVAKVCTNYGDVKELLINYDKYAVLKPVAEEEQQMVLSGLKFSKIA